MANLLAPLFGTPCWRVNWDCQCGLDLSFGEPYLEIREPRESSSQSPWIRELLAHRDAHVKATVWLWISGASPRWEITLADGMRANARSSLRRMGMTFARLEGQILTGIAIDGRTGCTIFRFDHGAVVEVRAARGRDADELWILYKPNRYCFTVRSDGCVSHHRSHLEGAWRPLAGDIALPMATRKSARSPGGGSRDRANHRGGTGPTSRTGARIQDRRRG